MAKLRRSQLVEAYQYSGDPENPGWPKGWLGDRLVFLADGAIYDSRDRFSMEVVAGDWVIDDPLDGLGVFSEAEMLQDYEIVEA